MLISAAAAAAAAAAVATTTTTTTSTTTTTAAAHIHLFYCSNGNMVTNFTARLHHPHCNPPLGIHQLFPLAPKPSPSPTFHERSRNPRSQSPLHHVSLPDPNLESLLPSSATALAAAIRRASQASPVEFTQKVEKHGTSGRVPPSPDFQRLCVEQLDLFRMVVNRDAILSVYVRPAGSYVMDRLELRRVTFYPGAEVSEAADCIILVGNFSIPAGLRAAEAALSKQQVELLPEFGAVVLPMVKHPFIVGFLVAELPKMTMETYTNIQSDDQHIPFNSPKDGPYGLPPCSDERIWEIQAFEEDLTKTYGQLTTEQRSKAIMISRSLAIAYVMDQKAILLQQSSWQNNVRMSRLVEQIRDSLSSIRALSKMLTIHVKRSEISYDILEDILIQGDHIKDALQQLQDAVYLTKANILWYTEESWKKMHDPMYGPQESLKSLPPEYGSRETQNYNEQRIDTLLLGSGKKDIEMPMPPLLLVPLQQDNIRPCAVSDVLTDLVGAAVPLADKQQRFLVLKELSHPLQVAVEESALRQALSNLIEGALLRTQIGGRVEIYAARAPAGGTLIVIDDDGPDMHYMTQMHSLAPFGADLFSDGMVEDNITWNFVAGLTVAREILESYGCVVRVISPYAPDAALGAGGTRIELWLPAPRSDLTGAAQEG